MDDSNPQELAADPGTAPETLEQLAQSDDVDVVVQLARNPSTPAEALRFLNQKWMNFERSPRFLWGSFPLNPNCPGDILSEIAENTVNDNTKRMAREHPNFPK